MAAKSASDVSPPGIFRLHPAGSGSDPLNSTSSRNTWSWEVKVTGSPSFASSTAVSETPAARTATVTGLGLEAVDETPLSGTAIGTPRAPDDEEEELPPTATTFTTGTDAGNVGGANSSGPCDGGPSIGKLSANICLR